MLLEKINTFNELKESLSKLVEAQPLLSAYETDFYNLFYKEININFMGIDVKISSCLSDGFSSLNLTGEIDEDKREEKTINFNLDDKGLYEYFEELLIENRFKVLLDSSLDSIRNIYKKI